MRALRTFVLFLFVGNSLTRKTLLRTNLNTQIQSDIFILNSVNQFLTWHPPMIPFNSFTFVTFFLFLTLLPLLHVFNIFLNIVKYPVCILVSIFLHHWLPPYLYESVAIINFHFVHEQIQLSVHQCLYLVFFQVVFPVVIGINHSPISVLTCLFCVYCGTLLLGRPEFQFVSKFEFFTLLNENAPGE